MYRGWYLLESLIYENVVEGKEQNLTYVEGKVNFALTRLGN